MGRKLPTTKFRRIDGLADSVVWGWIRCWMAVIIKHIATFITVRETRCLGMDLKGGKGEWKPAGFDIFRGFQLLSRRESTWKWCDRLSVAVDFSSFIACTGCCCWCHFTSGGFLWSLSSSLGPFLMGCCPFCCFCLSNPISSSSPLLCCVWCRSCCCLAIAASCCW